MTEIRVYDGDAEKIDKLCTRFGISDFQVIQALIDHYLDQVDEGKDFMLHCFTEQSDWDQEAYDLNHF